MKHAHPAGLLPTLRAAVRTRGLAGLYRGYGISATAISSYKVHSLSRDTTQPPTPPHTLKRWAGGNGAHPRLSAPV